MDFSKTAGAPPPSRASGSPADSARYGCCYGRSAISSPCCRSPAEENAVRGGCMESMYGKLSDWVEFIKIVLILDTSDVIKMSCMCE